MVLAFPCNQFGSQEPKSNYEIKSFASQTYGVTFPLFAKVDVNGENTSPVYTFLKQYLPVSEGGGGGKPSNLALKWNFHKFLVGRDGYPVRYFSQAFDAHILENEILQLISQSWINSDEVDGQ